MLTTIEQIVKSYNPSTIDETKAVIREIVQSIVLIGLSRSGFFSKASFYGGTALRIFYNLNRYSEDLDFTLNNVDPDFSIETYTDKIREVALSYGLNLEIMIKNKKTESPIESAFAKLNTYQTFISLKLDNKIISTLHKDEILKVKFEIDCNPSLGFKTETKWLDIPEFAQVVVLDEPSLFAGKLHAILCRNYKNNVKGRDYYDFLFYMKKRIKPNLVYLRNKLIETGKINSSDQFDIDVLKTMLKEQFQKVDFNQVKQDAMRFVFNNEDLSFFSKDLFIQMVDSIDEKIY